MNLEFDLKLLKNRFKSVQTSSLDLPVRGVEDEDDGVGAVEVVPPEAPDLRVASEVGRREMQPLVAVPRRHGQSLRRFQNEKGETNYQSSKLF